MDIDGKICNNIPEAVNKLVLSARLDHSCETWWNKHDSYYSKQNSKFYYRVKFSFYHLQVYDKYMYFYFPILYYITQMVLDFRDRTYNSYVLSIKSNTICVI